MSLLMLRKSISTVIVLGVVVLLLTASGAGIVGAENSGCVEVKGKVSLEPVSTPGQCSSVYGCGIGTIKGDIRGTFQVVTTSLVRSPDFATTGVVFTTGDTVFTTPNGTLTSEDAITLSLPTGQYAEVITITGGTRGYEGATGILTATGGATATGASGVYSGQICTP